MRHAGCSIHLCVYLYIHDRKENLASNWRNIPQTSCHLRRISLSATNSKPPTNMCADNIQRTVSLVPMYGWLILQPPTTLTSALYGEWLFMRTSTKVSAMLAGILDIRWWSWCLHEEGVTTGLYENSYISTSQSWSWRWITTRYRTLEQQLCKTYSYMFFSCSSSFGRERKEAVPLRTLEDDDGGLPSKVIKILLGLNNMTTQTAGSP